MKKMVIAGLILTMLISLGGCKGSEVTPVNSSTDGTKTPFSSESSESSTTSAVTSEVEKATEVTKVDEANRQATEATEKVTDAKEDKEPENKPTNQKPNNQNKVEPTEAKPVVKPTNPPQQETPKPTEKPQTPVATEAPKPDFDIEYWVSYAKSYATSIGLEYDSSAVDCWDNPISTGPNCTQTGADIGFSNEIVK